jgi:hypothetical protein
MIFEESRQTGLKPVTHMSLHKAFKTEAESKEKHGVWDPTPDLTLCQHLQSRLQHIYSYLGHWGEPYARVDFIPQSGTSDLPS